MILKTFQYKGSHFIIFKLILLTNINLTAYKHIILYFKIYIFIFVTIKKIYEKFNKMQEVEESEY